MIQNPYKSSNILFRISRVFWPELREMNEQRRLVGTGDVITFLYSLPLAIAGVAWLLQTTDFHFFRQETFIFLLVLGLFSIFQEIDYFIIIEIRQDRYGSGDGSLGLMVFWSAVFLFGVEAIWIAILWQFVNLARRLPQSNSTAARWNLIRNFTCETATTTFGILFALSVYRSLGGQIPISGLSVATIIPAITALTIHFLLVLLVWSGYIAYHLHVQRNLSEGNSFGPILKFFLLIIGLPYLANPFAILAAGLFVQDGVAIYLFFITGMLLVAYMARRLSWSVESGRQQFRQLEKLEQLGRAIIDAPPDASELPDILKDHVPNMFPSGRVAVWLAPDYLMFNHPEDWEALPAGVWDYLLHQEAPQAFTAKDELPWDKDSVDHNAVILAPVLNVRSGRAIGGIYFELRTLVKPWDVTSLNSLFPGIQSLAAQIASALHQSEVYHQTLEYQKVSQELQLAGRIQASFLPNKFPAIPGWQLAVTLLPARETSGDFFDVIELNHKQLGVLIADVADKGVGPALYMALSRTLIRTYAIEYDADPEVIFYAANQRLLKDARANLFVTAFYGVLDPSAGTLTYCNAGHNPPYLFKTSGNGHVQPLERTGMALGVEEGATWLQASVQIQPGDVLILFTDGIPDAQNDRYEFFDEESLIEVVQDNLNLSAHELQSAILKAIQDFAGNSPQFDDITLMILARDL